MATTAAEQVMLNGPALTPPPGVKSNFVNPPNMDFIVILTISICTSFSTIAILLRLYTKLIVIRKVVFEDCMLRFNVDAILDLLIFRRRCRFGMGEDLKTNF